MIAVGKFRQQQLHAKRKRTQSGIRKIDQSSQQVIFAENFVNTLHSETEVYSYSSKKWTSKARYPFYDSIEAYKILSHSSSFILFGGWTKGPRPLSTVAKYDLGTDKWSQVGYLENARHGFGVVEINNFLSLWELVQGNQLSFVN